VTEVKLRLPDCDGAHVGTSEEPLDDLGIRFAVKHGEHSQCVENDRPSAAFRSPLAKQLLDAARRRADAACIESCYLDSSTRNRGAVLSEFKAGTAPVFFISLKAGASHRPDEAGHGLPAARQGDHRGEGHGA
jgi:hypothetical protein